MKLSTLEMMLCQDAYELLVWMNKNKNISIPSKKDFELLQNSPEVQTLGIWLDNVGLLVIFKMKSHSQTAFYSLSANSFPLSAKDVVSINSGFASDFGSTSPAKITLWLEPDLSPNDSIEIEQCLLSMGFVKEFANNWDKIA
jgi:hypothetical protein